MLSDYDLLAFDQDGKPSDGYMTTGLGDTIEIRKTWLRVSSKKMWSKDSCFVEPVIARVNEGNVTVGPFRVEAVRGPQEGFFFRVRCQRQEWDNLDYSYYSVSSEMVGIGCYGWESESIPLFEVTGNPFKKLPGTLDYVETGPTPTRENMSTAVFAEGRDWEPGSAGKNSYYKELIIEITAKSSKLREVEYTGILDSTYKTFTKWLKGKLWFPYGKVLFKKILRARPVRMNAGDLFFNREVGVELRETEIGNQSKPRILELIDTIN
jgi:hypothetical protein